MPHARVRAARLLPALLLALWTIVAMAELAVPPLTARVNDTVGILDEAARAALEAQLAAFEAERGTQIAALIVRSTEGESIEAYALRVAEAWKLGRDKPDDGALLVVALEDRALRIEVGYGLEGVLTDATSKRIIAETIVPAFRAGDHAGGIAQGLARMMTVAAGEDLPPPATRPQQSPFALALFFGVFFALMFRGLRAAPLRIGASGLVAGGTTLLLTQVFSAAGLSLVVAGLFAGLNGGGGPSHWVSHRRYGGHSPGGWMPGAPGGGFGGGGFSGGGFGGGGFSGGGGGFGGGGASGHW
jgi:uncharacterized protein